MNPKEKAEEIFNRMYLNFVGFSRKSYEGAKQCALIAVDEIISITPSTIIENGNWKNRIVDNEDYVYWEKVKAELLRKNSQVFELPPVSHHILIAIEKE